ncbi:pentapeptide repeat-containing protein [Desulfosediminicola sp.]|uniref:pentapeptide repeat-containing protein n=1 Tax=Desulfosediminicola sp. TaxID=2886825 RepID=UPI003AF2624E
MVLVKSSLTMYMKKDSPDILDYEMFEDEMFLDINLPQHTKFVEVEFCDCKFVNCKLSKVNFFNCRFERCSFTNCDLNSISVKHTVFDDVLFEESKLTGIQWAETGIPLDVIFRQCSLNYCSFINVDLKGTEITNCKVKEADFSEANLSRADCRHSDFTGTRFVNTNLEYTDLSDASNYSIHPGANKLKKTVFSSPDVLSLLDVYDIVIK